MQYPPSSSETTRPPVLVGSARAATFAARATTMATALAMAACGGGGTATPDAFQTSFDRNALLAHLAHNVLLPMQAAVDAKAQALPAAIDAYCDALDTGNVGTTRDAAITAWHDTVIAWQRADELLIGPAAANMNALRGRIYAWPSLAPCEIDRDVASHWSDPASYDISTKLGRQTTLTSIEFLLFNAATEHNCVTEPAGWSALGADLPRARCRLAHTIATGVATAAAELHAAWRPDGGNYAGELATAGTSASTLPGAHEAVNLVTNSFFYVDRMVKDMKLGEAAGIVMNNVCGAIGEPCINEVELRYSDRATFAIRANLSALREAVTGTTATGDGPGFDDFLTEVGHAELGANMTADLDAAIAKAAALPDSFLGALSNNYAAVVDTHTAVKLFTNDLKSQFLTVLALDIPDDVASDND